VRGLALKIFLSFWVIHAVLFATFALGPRPGPPFRLQDRIRRDGQVAAAVIESAGPAACTAFVDVIEQRSGVALTLEDSQGLVLCRSSDRGAIPIPLAATGSVVRVPVEAPSGAQFTAEGVALPAFAIDLPPPPLPYGSASLLIVISGLVCFTLARSLARPLRQVRDVSYRLAAGDLRARVGPAVGRRRDEIGDLVRDFDAMAARIETLVNSHRQLLSDISHELRSPLARLNVALELARRKVAPSAEAELGRIESEAHRMNGLIGQVLALARAEAVIGARTGAAVDVAGLVRRVVADSNYEATEQHKSVNLRIDGATTVAGDAELIASAVDNVLRNAVRHTPEHTTVEVIVGTTDSEAMIVIRDHGPGVPSADLDRIFMPFHRVDSARHRDAGGAGLGLAIAQRAVAIHAGTIRAENVFDGGLMVTIRIPVCDPRAGRQASD
jgi:two-component system, OmpR family, sensor histidine kinase CpxA